MPPLSSTTGRSERADRIIRRKKKQQKARGQQGPITHSSTAQPGPISDREYEIINKRKRKARYRVSLREARKHGPQTGRGKRLSEDKSVTPAQQRAIDETVREARVRYLHRTRTTGVDIVKRELEGKGLLAHLTHHLGEQASGGIAKVQLASLGKPTFGKRAPAFKHEEGVLKRAAADFANLPSSALPSLYQPAAALVEAAQGNPERLHQLGHEIDESDPAFNLAAAAWDAANGDGREAKERLDRAVKAAGEHPGLTAVELLSMKGAVGRSAGALGRSPVAPKVLRRIASTDRENRFLEGTDLAEHREYSRDLITKGFQAAGDKVRQRRNPREAATIPDSEVRRRVDEAVAVADEMNRNRTSHDLEDHPVGTDVVLRDFGVKRVEDLPEVAQARLREHDLSRNRGGKALKVVNRQFRETVLSTSPKWLAGNTIEGVGRAILNHAGPRSYVTGRRVLKRLEQITPDQAEEAMARMVGGGHYASVKRQRVELGPEAWKGSDLAPLANGLHKLWRTPGPKQAASLWHGWTELVFRQINGRIETALQTAHLGRELRRSNLMDGSWLKTGEKAIEQAAQGLKETTQQVRFGRAVDRAYGRYSKLSPGERHWISTYTPFIRWYLNSIDFVVRVLPQDHPIVTGLIAQAEIATDDWRRQQGLEKFVDGAMPDWLQGSIPTGGGAHQRVSQFTPFGAFSDFTGTAAGQLTPLFSGIAAALSGQTWTGDPLRVEGGDGRLRSANELERAVAAAHEFLKATVPGLSVGERVHEKGPRALDPFKDVAPKKTTTTRRKRSTAEEAAKRYSDNESSGGLLDSRPSPRVLPEGFFK